MTKLSIIVPVYNVEQYIRPCVESIFKQGLDDDDFEVIIVNDGSTDRSMEMIADLISQHNNITVINQENKSLSVARNNGIAIAKGEYILMPDSDDLLIENSIKPLLEKALGTKVDLVVANFLKMTNEDIESFHGVTQSYPDFHEKSGEQLFLEDLNPYECYVWRTLYRREFIVGNHLSFFPDVCYQDVPFTHECYLKAKNCLRTSWIMNIYRIREGSHTYSFNKKKAKDYCIVIRETWQLMDQPYLSLPLRSKLEDDIYTSFSIFYYSMLHSIKNQADKIEIVDFFAQQNPKLKFTKGLKRKFESAMLTLMPHLYLTMRTWHWNWIQRHHSTER